MLTFKMHINRKTNLIASRTIYLNCLIWKIFLVLEYVFERNTYFDRMLCRHTKVSLYRTPEVQSFCIASTRHNRGVTFLSTK